MNILLINQYAGSPNMGMEYRPFYLARYWIKMGHNVTIVAGSYSHVRTVQPNANKNITEENYNGINFLWIKTPRYNGNGIYRVLNMLTFVIKLLVYSRFIVNKVKPDAVIASSTHPLDIFPAYRISKESKAKLIFEVHDLWPLSPIELGNYSKFHPFIQVIQYAENFAYRNSDKVVSMLPLAFSHMEKHGLAPYKFNYIPNGIDISEWQANQPLPNDHMNFIKKLRSEGKKLIGYTGSIGLANALDSLVESAKLLQKENISFIVVGTGPEKQRLENMIIDYKLSNFFFLNPVNKEIIPSLLSEFDFVYIGLKKQSLFRFGISPNKLIDYMMAGKPVIHAIESGNNLVSEAGCGISTESENPESIADAIKKLLCYDKNTLENMGFRGREYILHNHNYESLSKKFIAILEE